MSTSRRHFLRRAFHGASGLTLASLATGLPASFLRTGQLARAATGTSPTFLVLATNGSGDPLNANCPGSYPNPEDGNDPRWQIEHATTAELGTDVLGEAGGTAYTAADFATGFPCTLGGQLTYAARPWADLPEAVRSNMAVIRHQMYTNAHPEASKVMEFHGAVKGAGRIGVESFPSMIAQELAASLGTTLAAPMRLDGVSYSNQGLEVRKQGPLTLQSLFANTGAWNGLEPQEVADFRDFALDRIYQDLQSNGTHAQRRVLDSFAISRVEARALAEDLSTGLAPVSTTDDPYEQQVLAAVALIEYRVTPVVTMELNFGHDNHQDSDLYDEVTETISGVHYLHRLHEELVARGLDGETSFAYLSVFGRGLTRSNGGGRNHYGEDHAMVMFGPHVPPGLYGGLTEDLEAGPIDDVPVDETLEAAGKTLAAAVGVPETVIDDRIVGGRIL